MICLFLCVDDIIFQSYSGVYKYVKNVCMYVQSQTHILL